MKKILLALTLGFSVAALAQPNITVTLSNPVANSTITAGSQFTFDVLIANTGTVAVAATDSIIFAPVLNGSFLTSGGNPVIYLDQQAIPVGGSVTVTRPLNISGGSSGQISFCALAEVWGPNWNVTESDTTDNLDCSTVTYNANSVSTSEFTVVTPSDESYFANGTFFVRVENQSFVGATSLSVYSISGAEVYNVSLSNDGSSINEDVNLSGLNKGIYLVEVKGLANRSVKKIAIQ